jgi:diacylglycerol kinase (ATP)
MMHERKIALAVNPLAGNKKAAAMAKEVADSLQSQKIAFEKFDASWPESWTSFSEVWILGGDGTLNYFVNQYPQIDLPLSIFAGGTGNDFHWMLYGNCTAAEQVNLLLQGRTKRIDAGLCNGRLFMNGLGYWFRWSHSERSVWKTKKAGQGCLLSFHHKKCLGVS